MRTFIQQITAIVVIIALSSCSLCMPGRERVTVRSNDPAAILKADGNYIGVGEGSVKLKRDRSHTITAEHGDKFEQYVIDKSLSVTGMLDIIGGCIFWIPFIGFCSAGAFTLDENYVHLHL